MGINYVRYSIIMRIIQIGPYPLSRDCIQGGVEASVSGLAQEQSRTSEVHAFDFPRIGGKDCVEQDGKVIVHRFCNTGKRQVSTFRHVKAMAKEIGALNPDICHLHGTGLFSWLMYRQLKRMGLKVTVTIHGLVMVEKRNMLKKGITSKRVLQYCYQGMVEKRFLSQLSSAIVDTQYVKEMVNRYPIRRKPTMHVIPQGIDERYFRIKCSQDSRILLSVGAIVERKGHLLTLKAFERVRKSGIECKLMVVGTVSSQAYYEKMKKAIEESQFRDDIKLLVDVADDKLKQLYESSHVFVLHSEEESQGIAFVEAMATGMPVVATKVGGIPFVVADGKTGLLSDYGDINAFAENIKRMLLDSQLWHNLSDASVASSESYHWTSINDRIMALYGSEEGVFSKSSNTSE